MSLHFPILIGLSKCTPGLSIPARVPDKNDLSRAFGGTLRRFPRRARPASCQQQQSVMESRGCFWFSMRSSETQASLYLPSPSSSQSSVPFYTLASHSACNKQVNISMQVHPPGWTHADTGTETLAQIHMVHTTHKRVCRPHAQTHWQAPAEGQHSEANLISVFMCSVSLCPCLFHTSCHHVPSPPLSAPAPVLSADAPEKHSGPKKLPLVFGLCSTSLDAHTRFDIFI